MKYNFVFKTISILSISLYANLINASTWEEKFYNPKPAKDDVALPMPCNGSMIFRKINVPVNQPLDDYPIRVGQEGTGYEFVEHSRPAYIAGSFSEGKNKSRYYLLAKYEMTQLQFQALMQENCPQPNQNSRIPIVNISWFDAMQAADKYNRWLRNHASEKIPKEDGSLGFVRLPTEVEWEFAARGGVQVQQAEYRDLRYPMPEALHAYEWFSGSQSSNGKLNLIGMLKPNPLGLHDMLGNVEEMVFEPFRLNKLDRGHGQAGGFIVRGGSYLTPEAEMRSSLRKESEYYDIQGARTAKNMGVRLALVASALTSRERIANIEKNWQQLGQGETSDGQKTTAQELSQLSAQVEDKKLKAQLKELEVALRASNQKQEEARVQAIRSSLNLGAFLCTKISDDGKYLDFLQKNYSITCEGENPLGGNSCPTRETKLIEQKDRVQKLTNYYAGYTVESWDLYGGPALEKQIPIIKDTLEKNERLNSLLPYLNTHWDNIKSYGKTKKIAADNWVKICKSVK